MIYNLSRDLEGLLLAQQFPIRVVYGPEHTTRPPNRDVIVLERDRDNGDQIGAPQGVHPNPTLPLVRQLGVLVHVYARANVSGARVNDHEHLCDQYVDAVLVHLREWAVATRAGALAWGESRYLRAEELGASFAAWPGVVYMLRFRVPRGVTRITFEGDARPEGAFTQVSNQTHTRINDDDDPAIGCGA